MRSTRWWIVQGFWLAAWAAAAPAAFTEEPPVRPPSPQATEAMRLLTSRDEYQRKLGFLRLEALREMSTLPTIKNYLQNRDPDTRAYSLRAVAAIEGPESVPMLVAALKTDKDPQVRRAALLGLEPFSQSDITILPVLLKALTDHDTEVRMTAVDVVSRIPTPQAREAILTRYKREQRQDVRRVLELAVKRLGR